MKLAVCKGICDRCKLPDLWLYSEDGKLLCDDCLEEIEDEKILQEAKK